MPEAQEGNFFYIPGLESPSIEQNPAGRIEVATCPEKLQVYSHGLCSDYPKWQQFSCFQDILEQCNPYYLQPKFFLYTFHLLMTGQTFPNFYPVLSQNRGNESMCALSDGHLLYLFKYFCINNILMDSYNEAKGKWQLHIFIKTFSSLLASVVS